MKYRLALLLAAALLASVASCSKSPAAPSSAAAAASASADVTGSIVASRPVAPLNNAAIRNVDQPVTLVVQNAISTRPGLTVTCVAVGARYLAPPIGAKTQPYVMGGVGSARVTQNVVFSSGPM